MDAGRAGKRRLDPNTRVLVPALVCLGVAVLAIAWAWATPFGGYPDELDHYLRAVTIGRGEVVGRVPPGGQRGAVAKQCCAPGNPAALAWIVAGTRFVSTPPLLDPNRLACSDVFDSDQRIACGGTVSASSPRFTTMGTIEPFGYSAAAFATRFARTPLAAVRLARLATGAVALALVSLGVFSLWRHRPTRVTVVGILVALTPATVAVMSSESTNSWELAGAFAFVAGLLALVGDQEPNVLDWCALGGGGVLLASSRSLGPIFACLLALLVLVPSLATGLRRARTHWVPLGICVALGVVASLLTAGWELAVQPHLAFSATFFVHRLGPAWHDAYRVGRETIGVFGAVTVNLPVWFYVAWAASALALIAAAGAAGDRGGRIRLAAAGLLVLAGFQLVSAAVMNQNGFGLQGRHILPLAMTLPLLAAHALSGRPRGLPGWLVAAVGVLVAGLQVVAWAVAHAVYVSRDFTLPGVAFGRHTLGWLGTPWLANRSAAPEAVRATP